MAIVEVARVDSPPRGVTSKQASLHTRGKQRGPWETEGSNSNWSTRGGGVWKQTTWEFF